MILPTMANILIGMSLFKRNSEDLAYNIGRFPEFTSQLKASNGKLKLQMLKLRASQKTSISPRQLVFVAVMAEKDIETVTKLLVSPWISEIRDQQTCVQITNHLHHRIALPHNTTVAVFCILTPSQAKSIQTLTNELLTLISDEAYNVINQLFHNPSVSTDKRWYQTNKTSDNPDKLNEIRRRMYDEIIQLLEDEKVNPTFDTTSIARRSSRLPAGTIHSSTSRSSR